MRVGLHLDPAGDPGEVTDEARLAEGLGFDLLSSGEHVFFYGPTSNAFITLTAAAAVTQQIKLLSALTILPLYPVVLAAKMAATLDQLSHGRFELGIGLGGEYAPEFEASGVPVAGRGARVAEQLPVLIGLLSGQRVTATGAFGSVDGMRLDPPPVQHPHPPIWMAGRKPAAMRRVGRFADVWLPYMLSPESFGQGLATVRTAAVSAGRAAESVQGGLFIWGSVDEVPGRARRDAVDAVSRIYNQDFESLADRFLLHGTPEQVSARIVEYAAAGVRSLIFAPACPPERRREVVTLFAEAVLPRCRELDQEERAHDR